MTIQTTLHFVALAVLLVAFQVYGRPEPYNLCEFKCVQAIYTKYCGGTPCVYGSMDGSQQKTLCTGGCLSAIEGEEMYYCLKNQDPLRGDFKLVQRSLAAQILGFCESSSVPVAPASQAAIDSLEEHDLD